MHAARLAGGAAAALLGGVVQVEQAAAVGADQHLGAGIAHAGELVLDHRARDRRMTCREGAAEAAALGLTRLRHHLDAGQRLQQRAAGHMHAHLAPRRARGVQRHLHRPARRRRRQPLAQPQHVAREGAELDHPRADVARLRQPRRILGEQPRPVVHHHPGARARGHDDRPGLGKEIELRRRDGARLVGVAAGVGRLAAATLRLRELDPQAGVAQQRDRVHAGLRRHQVDDAGGEEIDGRRLGHGDRAVADPVGRWGSR